MAEPAPKLVTFEAESDTPPFLDSLYDSSFELVNSISDLGVDFELTFEDLYSPSENKSFFLPVDATANLEMSGDRSGAASSSTTKKRRGEDMNSKYRRIDEEEDEGKKRDARLVRNRESALLSRQRKKHYVEELEDKVKSLQSVINDMNSKVSFFMSENVALRHKVGPGGKGMCWPGSGLMYPMPYPCMPFPAYQGCHRVVPLLPIPRLKPQRSLGKVKKSEGKTKKVASVSVLGLLFCLFLFGALAPVVNVRFRGIRGVFYGEYDQVIIGRVLDVFNNGSRGSDQGVGRKVSETENSLPLGNGNELLVASLFVPRNEKLVKLNGNLIIHSVSETNNEGESDVATIKGVSSALRLSKNLNNEKRRAPSSSRSDDSTENLNTTTANGEMQKWFREGVAGPMFSSEMCTEVFQFDVSSTSGAIRPTSQATQQPNKTTDTHKGKKNRRILRGGLPVTDFNLAKDQNSSSKENFNTTKPFPSMVVSVLTDPREEGSDGDMAGGTKPLSRVFIVVLVDGVKYVTYSCVLPRPEEVPHFVTT